MKNFKIMEEMINMCIDETDKNVDKLQKIIPEIKDKIQPFELLDGLVNAQSQVNDNIKLRKLSQIIECCVFDNKEVDTFLHSNVYSYDMLGATLLSLGVTFAKMQHNVNDIVRKQLDKDEFSIEDLTHLIDMGLRPTDKDVVDKLFKKFDIEDVKNYIKKDVENFIKKDEEDKSCKCNCNDKDKENSEDVKTKEENNEEVKTKDEAINLLKKMALDKENASSFREKAQNLVDKYNITIKDLVAKSSVDEFTDIMITLFGDPIFMNDDKKDDEKDDTVVDNENDGEFDSFIDKNIDEAARMVNNIFGGLN